MIHAVYQICRQANFTVVCIYVVVQTDLCAHLTPISFIWQLINKNIDRSQNIIYPLKATFNIFIMQWKKWSNKDNLTPIYHLNQIFKKYTENSVFWKMECLLNLLMTIVLKDTITNLF